MPKKFVQEAKGRVVRLEEDRIPVESISTQAACKVVAPKARRVVVHSEAMDAGCSS